MIAATQTTERFSNHIRFNWGYHDAVQCVREGWHKIERTFPDNPQNHNHPDQVLSRHPDGVYARGWEFGYWDAIGGLVTESSEPAWQVAKLLGKVSE